MNCEDRIKRINKVAVAVLIGTVLAAIVFFLIVPLADRSLSSTSVQIGAISCSILGGLLVGLVMLLTMLHHSKRKRPKVSVFSSSSSGKDAALGSRVDVDRFEFMANV